MGEKFVRKYRLVMLERIMAGLLLILGGGMRFYIIKAGWFASGKSIINNPGFLPNIIAYGFMIAAILLFIRTFQDSGEEAVINWLGVLVVGIWVVFGFLCNYIGFIIAGALALAATLILFGAKNKTAVLLTSVLTPVCLYLMLGVLLGVRLPTLFL